MPTLTYISNNAPHGGRLTSRVLIGRKLSHGVVVDDPAVLRLHAWIDPVAGDWLLTDAGGKAGTFVNEQRITQQALHDGDVIRVGTVQITFSDGDALPPDVESVELSSPTGIVKTAGILFDCHCGAPLWVGNDLAGKCGMCRHCQTPVTVPSLAPVVIAPTLAPALPKRKGKCGVCHASLLVEEQTVQCPDCAVIFHAECWQENFGCSSYGCPQVNALKPAIKPELILSDPVFEDQPPQQPWGLILLAASVVGSVFGALCFGVPAVIVAVISIVMLVRGKRPRRGLLIAAIIISMIGIPAGLAISDFWYLNSAHLPAMWIRH